MQVNPEAVRAFIRISRKTKVCIRKLHDEFLKAQRKHLNHHLGFHQTIFLLPSLSLPHWEECTHDPHTHVQGPGSKGGGEVCVYVCLRVSALDGERSE